MYAYNALHQLFLFQLQAPDLLKAIELKVTNYYSNAKIHSYYFSVLLENSNRSRFVPLT